jgi:UDP-glucose 4-epimerase
MRILVTGATGFLGSYLVADLLAHGHEVSVLVRPGGNPWRLSEVLAGVHVVEGSLTDVKALRSKLAAARPHAIAHMAWDGVSNVDRNRALQARNIPMTAELAELGAEVGIETFAGAGSHAEYGPYDRQIAESDETHPTTLYGKAKLAAGETARQLCSEHAVRFAWLRIFSTYGPKDADSWLIPSMIRTLRRTERMSLTKCEQRWSFLHARDAAAAFRTALVNPAADGIYNVGSPEAPELRDTVTHLRDLVNPAAELGFGDVPYRSDQVMVLQPDTQRLSALGWRPEVSLTDGLLETVNWYDEAKRS